MVTHLCDATALRLVVPVAMVVIGGACSKAPTTDEAPERAAPVAPAPEPTPSATPPSSEPTPPPPQPPAPSEPDPGPPHTEPPPAPVEPPPRLVQSKCIRRCKRVNGNTCVTRERGTAEPEALGCGDASPSGRFAVLRRMRGRGDDGGLVYEYVTAEGTTLHTDRGSCSVWLSADCEGPGQFLSLHDDGWMHLMGNAGDATNHQELWNIVTDRRHELPEGEYGVVVHPGGTLAGFFAASQGWEDPPWHITLGCFDFEREQLHQVWKTRMSDEKYDRYSMSELQWDGDALVLVDEDGKRLRHAVCPSG